MQNPKVSVLMATYNHANFVKQAIESVLQQENVDFELLVADDGSTDQTRDVIASMSDSRIIFFPYTENRGACVITNELIERSSGEFIAIISSDDYWIGTDKLAMQVALLENNLNIGACFGKAKFISKEGTHIDQSSLPHGNVFEKENRKGAAWLRYFFDFGNCICHPTILIRKSCYEKLGMYNNRLRQLPDFDMWIRLVKHYDIFIIDKELISFRIMPGENASSQTPTNSIRTINEHFLIAENFFDDVSREQLIDGFYDYLTIKKIPTNMHLEIEKARMYMIYNQWLGKPYQLIGLQKLYKLFSNPEYNTLMSSEYNIDDRWFQQKMSEIDVLRPTITDKIERKASKVKKILNKIVEKVTLTQ